MGLSAGAALKGLGRRIAHPEVNEKMAIE